MAALRSRAGRPAYRVRQFFAALWASLAPLGAADLVEARAALPPRAWPLFSSMERGDQKHSLNVLRTLRQRAQVSPPLAQAALLHDCAKHGAGVRLWHRVAVVLLAAWAPGRLAAWAAAAPPRNSWRYPFWAHLNHPQRGAALAAAAGCDRAAVVLIAHHHDRQAGLAGSPDLASWLADLQAADDDN